MARFRYLISPLAATLSPRLPRLLYALALFFGVLPLWAGRHLPMVDLPQHLHLISVLHRLDDPTTLYPQVFAARAELTPYLGYYYLVHLLSWLFPLELANRLFLTAYVAGMAGGMAFLLRSLKHPVWPSLLALPFAYGDSFAWGFVNYCSALPLAFVCCGLFVRAIQDSDARRRMNWAAGLAACLVAVLLFHVQAFAFLGLALPFLLLTTRGPTDDPADWKALVRARWPALVGVLPGVVLFLVWVVGRLGEPAQVEYGAAWKAWGPMLSEQNLFFKTYAQNRAELLQVVANQLRDGSDRYAFYGALAVAGLGWMLGLAPRTRGEHQEGRIERFRLLGLGAIALALYFLLPFDIRGYMYYLNTRFAHLAFPLLLAAVPPLRLRPQLAMTAAGALVALILGVNLGQGFRRFNDEAAALDRLAPLTGERPRVMGLIYNAFSAAVSHPVYLHSAAFLARERGGLTNFSFARTPHSPIRYQGEPPPTFPSEWQPQAFRWNAHGQAYDHFLLKGISPEQQFGSLLGAELVVVSQSGPFSLVRRQE